jgi:hypothetical protein
MCDILNTKSFSFTAFDFVLILDKEQTRFVILNDQLGFVNLNGEITIGCVHRLGTVKTKEHWIIVVLLHLRANENRRNSRACECRGEARVIPFEEQGYPTR